MFRLGRERVFRYNLPPRRVDTPTNSKSETKRRKQAGQISPGNVAGFHGGGRKAFARHARSAKNNNSRHSCSSTKNWAPELLSSCSIVHRAPLSPSVSDVAKLRGRREITLRTHLAELAHFLEPHAEHDAVLPPEVHLVPYFVSLPIGLILGFSPSTKACGRRGQGEASSVRGERKRGPTAGTGCKHQPRRTTVPYG